MTIPYHPTDIWAEISAMKKDLCNLKALHSVSKTNEEQQEHTQLTSQQEEIRKLLKANKELKEEILVLKSIVSNRESCFMPVQDIQPQYTTLIDKYNINEDFINNSGLHLKEVLQNLHVISEIAIREVVDYTHPKFIKTQC